MVAPFNIFSIWEIGDSKNNGIQVDCLLPTGILVPLKVSKLITLGKLKKELWKEAQSLPLYRLLKNETFYVFQCVNQMAECELLSEENKRLCDVKPFQPMLNVIENPSNRQEIELKSSICKLISRGLHEFDHLHGEVSDFRQQMKESCIKYEEQRKRESLSDWKKQLSYLHSPHVTMDLQLPEKLTQKLYNRTDIVIKILFNDKTIDATKIRLPCASFPDSAVSKSLIYLSERDGNQYSIDDYILKVQGRDEFLVGPYKLGQFLYIRKQIILESTPVVQLIHKSNAIEEAIPKSSLPPGTHARAGSIVPSPAVEDEFMNLWNVSGKFGVRILKITAPRSFQSDIEFCQVFFRAGIYHGGESICSQIKSKEVKFFSEIATFDQLLTFDIEVADLPRMARLCLSFKVSSGRRKTASDSNTDLGGHIEWVNMPIFDYKGMLRDDKECVLNMWPLHDLDVLTQEKLNPIGTVEVNPDVNNSIAISLSLRENNKSSQSIKFPPFMSVIEEGMGTLKIPRKRKHNKMSEIVNYIKEETASFKLETKIRRQLQTYIDRDPLSPLHEQEKEIMGKLMYECRDIFPHSLSKVLTCVRWNRRLDVAKMMAIMQTWPLLKPLQAMELLDFAFADQEVRKFAVKCLESFSDTDLCRYLLQLVQVLKYENYLECSLVRFLLHRSVCSQRVGHYLFWLLRSEMHVPSVSVRFGLILEAFFYGSRQQIPKQLKQVNWLTSLGHLSQLIKKDHKGRDRGKLEKDKLLRNSLRKIYEDIGEIQYTLDPGFRLGSFQVERCKVMSSKMEPIQLVCNDKAGAPISMLFKKGDDLRQDMLTLQILHIIDNIWQEAGLDLKMSLYGCLTTGNREGMIEMVTPSSTIRTILQNYAGSFGAALKSSYLYKWLKDNNPDEQDMNNAINEFTRSCAGYSVATYVLGIADRHSDNILMTAHGRLFHIDFGHILGNIKYKFGWKRERVPFVLPPDFVHIIMAGPKEEKHRFEEFKRLCEEAYITLRKHTNLLITLFLMMINTGIPQVSSTADVEFLKKTLQPGMSEEQAREHFRSKLRESLQNSYFTTLDWFFHGWKHSS